MIVMLNSLSHDKLGRFITKDLEFPAPRRKGERVDTIIHAARVMDPAGLIDKLLHKSDVQLLCKGERLTVTATKDRLIDNWLAAVS
jgi:hypothetical protein